MTRLPALLFMTILLTACADENQSAIDVAKEAGSENGSSSTPAAAPVAAAKPDPANRMTHKLEPPVRVNYRVIGEPIVGQPVAIDLQLDTSYGSKTLDLSYRVNDSTALSFPESQAQKIAISPTTGEGERSLAAQQVTVIPMREGRLFLNVAVSLETETGSWSSVTAVPIQVGQAPRELLENGTVTTDENGELIRSLPARED